MTTKKTDTESLVAEYEALVFAARKEIEQEAAKAMEHLNKATELCEKHGVSCRFSVSPISQNYVPSSFEGSKFQEIEEELRDLGLLEYSEWGGGWEQSAIC